MPHAGQLDFSMKTQQNTGLLFLIRVPISQCAD